MMAKEARRDRQRGPITSYPTPLAQRRASSRLRVMRVFSDAQRQSAHLQGSPDGASETTVAHLRSEFDAAVREGATRCTDTVQSAITNVVAKTLFVDAESIDPAKSVADSDVDSLITTELRNWFNQALGADISMLDLLDPNVGISTQAHTITDKALTAKA